MDKDAGVEMRKADIILLSFRHRNALSDALTAHGLRVSAQRHPEGVVALHQQMPHALLIIDARDAVVEALSAVEQISGTNLRLLLLLARADAEFAPAFAACGVAEILEADGAEPLRQWIARAYGAAGGTGDGSDRAAIAVSPQLPEAPARLLPAGTGLIMAEIASLAEANDRHGRAFGDAILEAASRRMARFLREEMGQAPSIRTSGSRLSAILGADQDLAELRALAEALHSRLEQPYAVFQAVIAVRPRVRFARAQAPVDDAALEREAALSPPVRAVNRRSRRISRALAAGHIHMLYQPVYAMQDDAITGAEALVRWRAPSGPVHGAAYVFAAAEAEGCVADLVQSILQLSCADLGGWPGWARGLRVALNIAPEAVSQPDFADRFLHLLARHRIEPRQITLEVTEHSMIEHKPRATAQLQQLRAAGTLVALDDFGSGFSSLAYLRELPVDIVKIDAGFSAHAAQSGRDRTILEAIIRLARQLDLLVVAEGVESREQRAILHQMGCTHYQGFLMSGALGADEFLGLAAAGTDQR